MISGSFERNVRFYFRERVNSIWPKECVCALPSASVIIRTAVLGYSVCGYLGAAVVI